MRAFAVCCALAAASVPGAVFAQTTQIAVPADAAYDHAPSGLEAPATVGGFQRESVTRFGEGDFNVWATYQDRATGTTATVYFYRTGLSNVSIWADRAVAAMTENPQFAGIAPDQAIAGTYTPVNGSGADTGYRSVFPISDSQFTATGLAIHAQDAWLVKIRMSSRSLDAAALDERLGQLLTELPAPEVAERSSPIAAIAPCATSLKLKKSKRAEPDMTMSLLQGAVSAMIASGELQPKPGDVSVGDRSQSYCRDAGSPGDLAVYRWDGTDDRYIIAMGDSGVFASVGRNDLGTLSDGKARYTASLHLNDADLEFAPFTTMPPPSQAMEVVMTEDPTATTRFHPETGQTTIGL